MVSESHTFENLFDYFVVIKITENYFRNCSSRGLLLTCQEKNLEIRYKVFNIN